MSRFSNSPAVIVGRYEVDDFPTEDDGSGKFGLETLMRVKGSNSPWQPYNRALLAADTFLSTGRGLMLQYVWWRDKGGNYRLIDSLDDDHRRFIARMLADRAPAWHAAELVIREQHSYYNFLYYAEEKGLCVGESAPTRDELLEKARKAQEAGDHLTWLAATPLFQRMVRGLAWTHPGVMSTSGIGAERG